jgi:hypothetical protein
MEKSWRAFVVVELSLFKRLSVSLVTCVDPLVWRRIHETQSPNASFLVKQILRILGSHIETKHVFSLVGVLKALRRYELQVDNLDQMVFVVKNWRDDPRLNCSWHKDFTSFLKVEFVLAKYNYDLIKESNYFEQLVLDKN